MARFMRLYCCMLLNNLIEPCFTNNLTATVRDGTVARLRALVNTYCSDTTRIEFDGHIAELESSDLKQSFDTTCIDHVLEYVYLQIAFEKSTNASEYERKREKYVPLSQMKSERW